MMLYVLIIIGYKYRYNQRYVNQKNVIFGNVKLLNIIINNKLKKGRIIEFLLNDTSKIPIKDKDIWYAKYVYPSNILMNDK